MKYILVLIVVVLSVGSVHAQKKNTRRNSASQEQKADVTLDSLKHIVKQAESGNAVAQNVVGTWYYKGEHYAKDYQKAYKWWVLSAKQFNVEALGNVGLLYQYGRGVAADSLQALKYYIASIERGNAALLRQREMFAEKGGDNFNSVLCAICYLEGKGVAKDLKKSVHFWELAAKGNSVDAYRELGFIYQRQKQDDAAMKCFKKAALLGDVPSAYQYAKKQLNDPASTGDKQEAVVFLTKAAEAGNVQAQCDLGTLYFQGKVVTQDQVNAVKWFKLAAQQEWALAQWNLALCYIDGFGVDRDYDQALYWLGEATSKGFMAQFEKMCSDSEKGWKDKPFMTYLKGMALYFGEKRDITGAYGEFKKIKKTIGEAQTMMAVCLANKDYKKPKAKKAVKELTKVANAGNHVAEFYLASLYEAGNGTAKDPGKAVELYQRSANGGYAVAQCYLGNLFYEGRLVTQSYSDAVRYYAQAEAQGQLSGTAAAHYAQCFEKGLGGLQPDAQKASALKKRDFTNHVVPMLRKL